MLAEEEQLTVKQLEITWNSYSKQRTDFQPYTESRLCNVRAIFEARLFTQEQNEKLIEAPKDEPKTFMDKLLTSCGLS